MSIIRGLFQKLSDPLHKNAIFLMMNSLGTSGLGFIFWMIVARLYPTEEVGLASAIISSMLLLAMLGNLGFGIGLIRFLPETTKKDANDMINSCLTISSIFSFILVVIFISGLSIWSPPLILIRENFVFILLFFIFTLTWVLSTLLNNIFISKRSAKYAFIKDSGVFSSLKILLLPILLPLGAFGIFSAWGISIAIAFILFLAFFLPKVQPGYMPNLVVKKHTINDMLHFSFGNYVAENFRELPRLLMPLIIINLLSASDAGYFYIAWVIASLLFMIPISTSRSLLAEGSINEDTFRHSLKKSMKFIFFLLIPVALFIFFLGDKLLLLIGESYSNNAFEMLKWFALSGIPFTINVLYITIMRIEKKVTTIILIYAVLGIGSLGLSYFLIGKIGLIGVGIGWFAIQSLVGIAILIFILKSSFVKNRISL